jgi:CheY-like chemotaxis protein
MDSARHVLIIDDDDLQRMLMSGVLEALKIPWLVAVSGDDAIRVLEEQGETVSLILMDLAMPLMDGFTLFEKLRALPGTTAIPVVAVTAQEPRIRDQAVAAGMAAALAKPFTVGEFREIIKTHYRG